MKEKTICALATPIGTGGISIIRISGNESLNIAKNFFVSKQIDFDNIKPRYLYLGNFVSEEVKDQVLMVYFKAPYSFTGEDVVEFQFHGGQLLAQKILKSILTKCSLAEPGEFSKRAFLNGKISLDEAEGISELILAESDTQLKAAEILQSGKLTKTVVEMQNKITDLLAEIEANLDYPDDVEENQLFEKSYNLLEYLNCEIEDILENSKNSNLIRSGVNVAIVGKTNVGKSSLLNALLGEERAIVTNIEGTTRDTIKEKIFVDGITINLIDTAGLRESEDIVEKIGIEKTNNEIKNADIVLVVLDLSRDLTQEEIELLESIKNRPHIIVGNKSDIKNKKFDFDYIEISAKNNENVDETKKQIIEKTISGKIDFSKLVLTNERHIAILKNAKSKILEALKKQNVSLDIVAFLLKDIWKELGKISGTTEDEKIIDLVFSKFCLGK
ncbi:MAG: tRNA uridine-5-carboxymethylaminomethyl(34) synthesis GTPase MnmE [Firmicutes bacterium]|nr:tRNA uridine-5-carboxymethylaminomethyl(34) synthesis GTPase MnmE [Bacillota bacterium]